MMKDLSYCYKFYWLEAVVHIISEGKIFKEADLDNVIYQKVLDKFFDGEADEKTIEVLQKAGELYKTY